MKFTIKWLERHLKKNINIEQIQNALDNLHLEVESIVKIGGEGFFVAEILNVEKHPNSDKLNICTVSYENNNEKKIQEVVCGAENVRVGLKTILANVGTKLPCGIILHERKIRGIISNGMLLSYEEFGLKHIKKEGIIDENLELLQELIKEDYIIDISLPANRFDLSSVRGIGMELASYFKTQLKDLYTDRTLITTNNLFNNKNIIIENKDLFSMFSTLEIRNFQLKNNYYEIISLLFKVINLIDIPIVNVANYITHDLGVPLHIYDLDKINDELHLTLLKKEEKFMTLNREEIILKENNMVIQDKNKKTLVVAGIIGGLETACTKDTKNILIEAAIFNKKYYISAYRDLKIDNKSTYYFNRGINYFTYMLALEYFKEFLNGDYSNVKILNNSNINILSKSIFLPYELFYNVTGLSFSMDHIKSLLEQYNYRVNIINKETDGLNNEMTMEIIAPLWKKHITNTHDVIEEIIRISPENIIENKDIKLEDSSKVQVLDSQELLFKIQDLFVYNGYKEIISYSFIEDFENENNKLYIPNAIGNNKYLRSNLRTSMEKYMENIVNNKLGMEYNGKLFEISKVFHDKGNIIEESYNLSIGILNNIHKYPKLDIKNEFVNIICKLESILQLKIKLSSQGEIKINNEVKGCVYIKDNYLIGEIENINFLSNKKIENLDINYIGPFIMRDYSCIISFEKLERLLHNLSKMKKNLHYSIFDHFNDSYGLRIKYFTEDDNTFLKLETEFLQLLKKENISLR